MQNNERLLTADIDTKLPPAATVEALRRAIAGPLQTEISNIATNHVVEVFFPNPQMVWVIPHTLGHRPTASIFAESGERVEAPYVSTANLVTISFAFPFSGSAEIR